MIERLASEASLGIFAGAGISVEAGLPSWSELVSRLLRELAPETAAFRDELARAAEANERERLRGRDAEAFAGFTTRTLGLLGAAAVAKRHLGEAYIPALARALYDDAQRETLAPGPTAISIARFVIRSSTGDPQLILTTNYDRLIEVAFVDELRRVGKDGGAVRTAIPGEDFGDGEFVIVHLHGLIDERLPPDQQESGAIVFAEDEYYVDSAEFETRRELVSKAFLERPYLFLGTSLTDPNVLRYLYEEPPRAGAAHAALAVGQSAAADSEGAAPHHVVAALQSTQADRLRSAGVEVVFVDTYCEAGQFVRELELQRHALSKGSGPKYGEADRTPFVGPPSMRVDGGYLPPR